MGNGEPHKTEQRLLRVTATRSETVKELIDVLSLRQPPASGWVGRTARVQKGLQRLRPLTCLVAHTPEEGRVRL